MPRVCLSTVSGFLLCQINTLLPSMSFTKGFLTGTVIAISSISILNSNMKTNSMRLSKTLSGDLNDDQENEMVRELGKKIRKRFQPEEMKFFTFRVRVRARISQFIEKWNKNLEGFATEYL
jgi:hypothetical protein